MKFYLASSFKLRPFVETTAKCLTALGHEIPDVWWNIDAKNDPEKDDRRWHAKPNVQAIAARHWKTIDECDALILVSHPTESTRFTGANIELGYAVGRGKTVFTVGAIERSGMYAPAIKCDSITELIDAISIFSREVR